MTATELLASLRTRGFMLWLDERPDGLTPRLAPAARLTLEDREAIKAHRAGLMDALLAESREQAAEREAAPYAPRTRFRWSDQADGTEDCGTWNWTRDELMNPGETP